MQLIQVEDSQLNKLDWHANLYDNESTYYFLEDDQVVAEIVLFKEERILIIDNFQCRWESCGYGTRCICYLMELAKEKGYRYLKGESVPSALEFWQSLGATFGVANFSESDLTPFTILLN